jgi:hypothetical protein
MASPATVEHRNQDVTVYVLGNLEEASVSKEMLMTLFCQVGRVQSIMTYRMSPVDALQGKSVAKRMSDDWHVPQTVTAAFGKVMRGVLLNSKQYTNQNARYILNFTTIHQLECRRATKTNDENVEKSQVEQTKTVLTRSLGYSTRFGNIGWFSV